MAQKVHIPSIPAKRPIYCFFCRKLFHSSKVEIIFVRIQKVETRGIKLVQFILQHILRSTKQILMERNTRGSSNQKSCIIEYDGASKGNPGRAGAGAVIRHPDGTTVARLREGVGNTTNNVAEYRGAILGLDYAQKNGYTNVSIQGDSQLVNNQVQGLWQTRNPNMAELRDQVRGFKDQFQTFESSHVPRGYNTDADFEANRGVHLKDGEVEVEYYRK